MQGHTILAWLAESPIFTATYDHDNDFTPIRMLCEHFNRWLASKGMHEVSVYKFARGWAGIPGFKQGVLRFYPAQISCAAGIRTDKRQLDLWIAHFQNQRAGAVLRKLRGEI